MRAIETTKTPLCGGFRALSRTRTGDRLLTMNVGRGPTHAGLAVAVRVCACRR